MGRKYVLAIAEQGEFLSLDDGVNYRRMEGRHLFLADRLLRASYNIEGNSHVERALQEFAVGLGIDIAPINIASWKRFFPGESPFLIEIRALRYAVKKWLREGQKPHFYLNSFAAVLVEAPAGDLAEGFAVECFLERCKQLYARPEMHQELFNGQLVTVYITDTLLPLAWAEIWYALDHRLKFGVCPFCNGTYKIPVNAPWKGFCGEKECRKAKLINDHGGIEEYRKWERKRKNERKYRTTKKKRGRPKKLVE